MNYINILHRKKVYLVTRPTFSNLSKFWPRLLNKLFSYERYWCNSFRFLFRVLDLYKKISISRNSEVVKFSALVLQNLNFKMVETSFCARYNKNIGAIFSVSPNYKTYHWFKLKFQHWPNKTHPIACFYRSMIYIFYVKVPVLLYLQKCPSIYIDV